MPRSSCFVCCSIGMRTFVELSVPRLVMPLLWTAVSQALIVCLSTGLGCYLGLRLQISALYLSLQHPVHCRAEPTRLRNFRDCHDHRIFDFPRLRVQLVFLAGLLPLFAFLHVPDLFSDIPSYDLKSHLISDLLPLSDLALSSFSVSFHDIDLHYPSVPVPSSSYSDFRSSQSPFRHLLRFSRLLAFLVLLASPPVCASCIPCTFADFQNSMQISNLQFFDPSQKSYGCVRHSVLFLLVDSDLLYLMCVLSFDHFFLLRSGHRARNSEDFDHLFGQKVVVVVVLVYVVCVSRLLYVWLS